jgi:hypothetical protein
MVQAWSTRRSDRSAAERALELQHSELTRQREHEQMLSQSERTERWLDQCCRPVDLGLASLINPRSDYVAHTVFELEASHPQAVAEMLAFSTAVYPIGADGKARSARAGRLVWGPNLPTQLTRNFGSNFIAAPSAAAYSVRALDSGLAFQQPFSDELPQAMLDVVTAEPASTIAHSHRRCIRTLWEPGVQYITDILKANLAAIEWPTKEWLAKQFPGVPWHILPNYHFAEMWIAYTMSWDRVLAEWDEAENFTVLRPTYPIPFMGLVQAIAWSRERGEAAQQELIGMTAEAEVSLSALVSIVSGGVTTSSGANATPDPEPAPRLVSFETVDT